MPGPGLPSALHSFHGLVFISPSASMRLHVHVVGEAAGDVLHRGDVARRFPDDMDVQTLLAEGLMNTNPWKLWSADGKPGPGTPAILAALQTVLARDPKHPGANHYWIHAVEASLDPARAIPSADVLVGMMPAAGHLEHMPAHIFQRVGRYEEAAEANRKGAAADVAYLELTPAPDYYPMYLIHNYQFLAYSAAMEGRRAETVDALRKARAAVPDAMLLAMPGLDWSIGYLYDGMARFGLWDEIIAEPAPNPKLTGLTIAYLQARATALAAKGRVAEAKALLPELERAIAAVPAEATQGQNVARPLYEIGALKAKARIALAERRRDAAIALLREATAREDKLAYNEPSDEFFPVRHLLGAALLDAGRAAEAEAVYREDLKRQPGNGWALHGLALALGAQKKGLEGGEGAVQPSLAARRYGTDRFGLLAPLTLGIALPEGAPEPVSRDGHRRQDHQGDQDQREGELHLLAPRQPRAIGVEADRTAEKVGDQGRGGLRRSRRQHHLPVAPRRRRVAQALRLEAGEEIGRDRLRPHVGIIDGRIAGEVAERCLRVDALGQLDRRIAFVGGAVDAGEVGLARRLQMIVQRGG